MHWCSPLRPASIWICHLSSREIPVLSSSWGYPYLKRRSLFWARAPDDVFAALWKHYIFLPLFDLKLKFALTMISKPFPPYWILWGESISSNKILKKDSGVGVYLRCNSPHMASLLTTKIWWRNQLETFFALLALCAGNSTVIGEFP